MTAHRIQLITPLTPDECVARLTAAIDIERFALVSLGSLFGSKPVIGHVTTSSLTLRKRIGYRNSFQSFMTATITPQAGKTLITGKVGMHPFVTAFMLVWFSGVVLIGGTMFLVGAVQMLSGSASQKPNTWLFMVIPPAMFAFGCLLVTFCRFLAQDEHQFLRDFLIRTLDAHELTTKSN